jgi:hypothetical protein
MVPYSFATLKVEEEEEATTPPSINSYPWMGRIGWSHRYVDYKTGEADDITLVSRITKAELDDSTCCLACVNSNEIFCEDCYKWAWRTIKK